MICISRCAVCSVWIIDKKSRVSGERDKKLDAWKSIIYCVLDGALGKELGFNPQQFNHLRRVCCGVILVWFWRLRMYRVLPKLGAFWNVIRMVDRFARIDLCKRLVPIHAWWLWLWMCGIVILYLRKTRIRFGMSLVRFDLKNSVRFEYCSYLLRML